MNGVGLSIAEPHDRHHRQKFAVGREYRRQSSRRGGREVRGRAVRGGRNTAGTAGQHRPSWASRRPAYHQLAIGTEYPGLARLGRPSARIRPKALHMRRPPNAFSIMMRTTRERRWHSRRCRSLHRRCRAPGVGDEGAEALDVEHRRRGSMHHKLPQLGRAGWTAPAQPGEHEEDAADPPA